MTLQISGNATSAVDPKPKVLRVACELAPAGDNPGLFWIGWSRPLADDDFRQLRRVMLCWRPPDLEKNGLEGLDEGWRITGEGLEQAATLGYQIIIDGAELPPARGSFRAGLLRFLEARNAPQAGQKSHPSDPEPPLTRGEIDCQLAPILVKFLRPEGAIVGADLQVYGPFLAGEVAPIPYVQACVFINNAAAEIYGG